MTTLTPWPDILPEERRGLLTRLIYERIESDEEREVWLSELETAAESDAKEIESLLNA